MNIRKIATSLFTFFMFLTVFTVTINAQEAPNPTCGHSSTNRSDLEASCTCSGGVNAFTPTTGGPQFCCGWVIPTRGGIDGEVSNRCFSSPDLTNENAGDFDITSDVTNQTLDSLNPLIISGSNQASVLTTPGAIVSRLLAFLFPLAGLILFIMIVWGGFEILLKSSDSKGLESGKNRITAAIIGFLLLFSSYWIVQIIEVIFGIAIL